MTNLASIIQSSPASPVDLVGGTTTPQIFNSFKRARQRQQLEDMSVLYPYMARGL